MPIYFNKKEGWYVKNPTKDEEEAIREIGKRMIVEGLAGSYTNERYKKWLESHPLEQFFNA